MVRIYVVYNYGQYNHLIHRTLRDLGVETKLVMNTTPVDELRDLDGLVLGGGPSLERIGNCREYVKELEIPILGICLGHQLLSIAHGYPTYKLKFGHHGGNHPVMSKKDKRVEITAQNHNYNVPKNIEEIAAVTHTNLFDNTIEGLKYKNSPIFSVQHHPEASPGPHDSRYIFEEFAFLISSMKDKR
jgi:carbamoyl-phosphate synthase small subunit